MAEKINTKVVTGFVELVPEDQIKFNNLKKVIEEQYQVFGFLPIDTPAIERAEVLKANISDETVKQIYQFKRGKKDLALRFDLTVPLARYVADHFNDLNFPFKRYHIGKSYRAEKPQKGRFREFYQADVDVVGVNNLEVDYDLEMLTLVYQTFQKLDVAKFKIRINNRQILSTLIKYLDCGNKEDEILRILDKKEKVGVVEFKKMMLEIGLNNEQVEFLIKFISVRGLDRVVSHLKSFSQIEDDRFKKAIKDFEKLISLIKKLDLDENCFELDLSIARGLNYYTGLVFETNLLDYPEIGSVCSGGRYDNLIATYSSQKMQGFGFSIGLSRLFDQLRELNLLKNNKKTIDLLIISLDSNLDAIEIAKKLREQDLKIDINLSSDNLRKKMKNADKRKVEWVLLVGENEVKNQKYILQNMKTGEKKEVKVGEIREFVK